MKWTDSLDIAIALSERHPEVDPKALRFTELREWVMALPEFDDEAGRCGEKTHAQRLARIRFFGAGCGYCGVSLS